MTPVPRPSPLTTRLVASLHVEAMVLSDEVRSYFDGYGRTERAALDAVERVYFSCESLKVTTRLMHIVAWLITQRARQSGDHVSDMPTRLGHADTSDPAGLIGLPAGARALILSSQDLYRRVAQLDSDIHAEWQWQPSPARRLLDSLHRAF